MMPRLWQLRTALQRRDSKKPMETKAARQQDAQAKAAKCRSESLEDAVQGDSKMPRLRGRVLPSFE